MRTCRYKWKSAKMDADKRYRAMWQCMSDVTRPKDEGDLTVQKWVSLLFSLRHVCVFRCLGSSGIWKCVGIVKRPFGVRREEKCLMVRMQIDDVCANNLVHLFAFVSACRLYACGSVCLSACRLDACRSVYLSACQVWKHEHCKILLVCRQRRKI